MRVQDLLYQVLHPFLDKELVSEKEKDGSATLAAKNPGLAFFS